MHVTKCRSQASITLTGVNKTPQPMYEDVGFKTLAVIGGSLNLYGMPGGNLWAAIIVT